MLKNDRLLKIVALVDQNGSMTVNGIAKQLQVSTMTVRRDLDELANENQLLRVHGGAESLHTKRKLIWPEKIDSYLSEKHDIAKIVASLINENDTIFLGPGTTNELVCEHLDVQNLRVVTNSLSVFNRFRERFSNYDLILAGGSYQATSSAFTGSLTNEFLSQVRMTKAFVGANGINQDEIMDDSADEGKTQQIALNNSGMKYITADHHQIGHDSFYTFYSLDQLDGLITDNQVNPEILENYSTLLTVITKPLEVTD